MSAIMAMNQNITIRIPNELADAFERYMADIPDGAVTRQDAVWRILEDWLTRKGFRAEHSPFEDDLINPSGLSL